MLTKKFVTFGLDGQLFGIDILMVREINRHLDISTVPHVPEYVRGLVNLRGQIVTVLDLKKKLGLDLCTLTEQSHNIILKTEGELSKLGEADAEGNDDLSGITDKVSFVVDSIGDIITAEEDEIDPPPANIGVIDGKYLLGVVKKPDCLMAILSAKKVLVEAV